MKKRKEMKHKGIELYEREIDSGHGVQQVIVEDGVIIKQELLSKGAGHYIEDEEEKYREREKEIEERLKIAREVEYPQYLAVFGDWFIEVTDIVEEFNLQDNFEQYQIMKLDNKYYLEEPLTSREVRERLQK